MALGVNGINSNLFAAQAGTVSGTELAKVTGEIFSATKSISQQAASFNPRIFNTSVDVSLYGLNASRDTDAIKLAAANTAGLNVSLSNNALSAISTLNAKAANVFLNDVSRLRDGLINVSNEKFEKAGLNSAFASSSRTEVAESMNLSKDRKGSGSFYVPQRSGRNTQKQEGINIIA